jgi:hypothetical protein
MNIQLGMMNKEAFMDCFKLLSQHLLEWIEESYRVSIAG